MHRGLSLSDASRGSLHVKVRDPKPEIVSIQRCRTHVEEGK